LEEDRRFSHLGLGRLKGANLITIRNNKFGVDITGPTANVDDVNRILNAGAVKPLLNREDALLLMSYRQGGVVYDRSHLRRFEKLGSQLVVISQPASRPKHAGIGAGPDAKPTAYGLQAAYGLLSDLFSLAQDYAKEICENLVLSTDAMPELTEAHLYADQFEDAAYDQMDSNLSEDPLNYGQDERELLQSITQSYCACYMAFYLATMAVFNSPGIEQGDKVAAATIDAATVIRYEFGSWPDPTAAVCNSINAIATAMLTGTPLMTMEKSIEIIGKLVRC